MDLFVAVILLLFLVAFAAAVFDMVAASCFAAVNFAIRSDLLRGDPLTVVFGVALDLFAAGLGSSSASTTRLRLVFAVVEARGAIAEENWDSDEKED